MGFIRAHRALSLFLPCERNHTQHGPGRDRKAERFDKVRREMDM